MRTKPFESDEEMKEQFRFIFSSIRRMRTLRSRINYLEDLWGRVLPLVAEIFEALIMILSVPLWTIASAVIWIKESIKPN